ncbi:MAG: bifunctional folylpolyglutamate synthase/dihydrofolate synthase, partial [Lachnospiraceae bacterium]|nr:bifunctional folylpolyglutamate synthase/dihydrofolate synthase [Lachnospiraceae bacterium]
MKYQEALDYLESLSAHRNLPEAGGIRRLCEYLGNPQKELKFVHIAGSNGDGSVLAYVSAILKSAGFRVGQYFSPFIFDYREKIQVNERPIT